ncbi:hypothetical protein QBZ16_004652 [Prototheca wickerhamii]|uniref:Glutaredoxin domain-containing protein n=1 Tax=Prototheca wickerhamii TaxID=3111 RepID=A0AAD9MH10_PROWI|nr:hypothetical protein QBZ16_004652 [Prototheca wickerhamii]
MSSLRLFAQRSIQLRQGARSIPALGAQFGRPGPVALYSTEDDSHDDFKPQVRGEAAKTVAEQIKEDVTSHPVFIYMKGNPDRPMCGFSNMACRILDAHDVPYGSRDIFIGGEFVGGSDILYQMHQEGELETQLKTALEAANKA